MGSNLVVDVSVFIDRLFIYREERSKRAQNLFRYIGKIGLNVFEPQVFGVELVAQLVRRKQREVARKVYEEIIDRVIILEDIDYDLLLDIALQTACRAIDAYYIATASLASGVLVSADKVMVDNAKNYGIDAYYILDTNDYNKLISKISRTAS